MKIYKVNTAKELKSDWDHLATSVYQSRSFLMHLEHSNFSDQRYYSLFRDDLLCAGAVIYSLKINLFTYSKVKLNLPMNVIGLPISNDQNGLLGNNENVNALLSKILQIETGIIICLNYLQDIDIRDLIFMRSLPSMIFDVKYDSWSTYLKSLRHPYRRRIKKALNKKIGVKCSVGTCKSFSTQHYNQYLATVERSNAKLEIMDKIFFEELPEDFKLRSYYDKDKLVFWNITIQDRNICHFLFGGIDYSLRNSYDSYANNLIDIIKKGFTDSCIQINLGQTAEISKFRFGANAVQKKMFLYHNNKYIRLVFKMLRNHLSHTKTIPGNNVYNKNKMPNEIIASNQLMDYNYAETK